MKEVQAVQVFELDVRDEHGALIATPDMVNGFVKKVTEEVQKVTPESIKEDPDNAEEYKNKVKNFRQYSKTLTAISSEIMSDDMKEMYKSLQVGAKEVTAHCGVLDKVFKTLKQDTINSVINEAYDLIDKENRFSIKFADFKTEVHELIKNIRIKKNMTEKATKFAEEQREKAEEKQSMFESIQESIEMCFESNGEPLMASYLQNNTIKFLNDGLSIENVVNMVQGDINEIKLKRQEAEEKKRKEEEARKKAEEERKAKAEQQKAEEKPAVVEQKPEPKPEPVGISKDKQAELLKQALSGVGNVQINKNKEFVFTVSCDIHVMAEDEAQAWQALFDDWGKYFSMSEDKFEKTLKGVM